MKISEFSVKHSLLVNLLSIFIIIGGLYTLYVYKIQREAFPEISFDQVIINTVYPGAPPTEVEKLITVPLETELKGVDGIEEMRSGSIDDLSSILMQISEDVKDKDKVVDDIKDAVERVEDLPQEAEEPIVIEVTSGQIPIVEVALSGELSEAQLQSEAEIVEDMIEAVPAVSSVERRGWRDQEVWVEVNPEKLSRYHLSLDEVMDALGRRNVSIPGGKVRSDEEYIIRTTGEFYNKQEIENVVIRANELGNWLRISDVANVRFTFEDEEVINKSLGERSIVLTVVKSSSGDAVKIVQQVKEKINNYIDNADNGLEVSYIDDMSYYIKRRLGVLKNNGAVGLILVVAILLLFLNFRVALLTAIGLPIAFFTAISVMGIFDISVNLITMFGLIIVLGMLVDDGIVVAENCSRYLEKGLSPAQAAIIGTQEVVKPVTVTIITTIAAFGTLLFVEGILGKFIWGIPVVVTIALLASLIEALVILPSHFADFVKKRNKDTNKNTRNWFSKIIEYYHKIVNRALNKRYLLVGGLILVLIATFLLASNMRFILFGSEEGIDEFYIKAEAPIGTNLYRTEELMRPIEEAVGQLPDDELDSYITEIGTIGRSWMFDPYGKSGSHVAQIVVYLKPYNYRPRSIDEIIESLRNKVEGVEGFKDIYFEKEQAGPPVGKPVSVDLSGEKFTVLESLADGIIEHLKGIKGVSDVASDYEVGRGEIRVVVDQDKASQAGLAVSEIATSVRRAFRGGVATSIKPVKAEEEIDVLVRFPPNYRDKRVGFDKIVIPNKRGDLIPLFQVAHLEDKKTVSRIRHLNGKRTITVRANVDKVNITSAEANKMLAAKFSDITQEYPGYNIEFGGEQEENIKAAKSFVKVFALAFFLIFLILAAHFNSLVQPFIVMMAIPFGLVGVIWSFFFHGYTLSFFMFMGIVGLTGIVVNDSIILVDFINNLRKQGQERRDSIVEAGRLRLRPVILTTVTTALGLAPTAYGIGGGDPFLKPMAVTIVWGVICASALTLVVLPCIYAIIDDIVIKVAGHTTCSGNHCE